MGVSIVQVAPSHPTKFDLMRIEHTIFLLIVLLSLSLPALANDEVGITEKVVINATPEIVFDALRKERDSAEAHRKTISYDGKIAKVDEHAQDVPVFGKVHCVMQETEHPYTRLDYTMLESDHFKSMSGHYILSPSADNKSTTLELQSSVDPGIRIPFAGAIARMGQRKSAKERLVRIKSVAEKESQSGIAKAASPSK
jgi:hypothetical protein